MLSLVIDHQRSYALQIEKNADNPHAGGENEALRLDIDEDVLTLNDSKEMKKDSYYQESPSWCQSLWSGLKLKFRITIYSFAVCVLPSFLMFALLMEKDIGLINIISLNTDSNHFFVTLLAGMMLFIRSLRYEFFFIYRENDVPISVHIFKRR